MTNLPHLYVNTFTGNPIVSKTEQVWARLWLVDEQDVVTFYDSISIRGRGNSTWNLARQDTASCSSLHHRAALLTICPKASTLSLGTIKAIIPPSSLNSTELGGIEIA